MRQPLSRRDFLALSSSVAAGLCLPGCGEPDDPARYTAEDIADLAAQRAREAARSGKGPSGPQTYHGYRGLAELPWFELDADGNLACTADDFPTAIDFHAHFGMSLFLAPEVDLTVSTPRVEHLLDCDGTDPGCELDLDVYINANFTEEGLAALQRGTIAQATIGSRAAKTHTIPNLIREMDASRVAESVILPIAVGFPFGDDLADRWRAAVAATNTGDRFHLGGTVHPRASDRVAELERQAAAGARIIKLHPTVQRFHPDGEDMMEVYEACDRLGLAVFFHGGRAGIEPEATHRYALPRHYEAALADFPDVPFVIGHSGARDVAGFIPLAQRYENAWLGVHGQGVTSLHEILEATGGERMLFGTDWPWYHLCATLAKVLIVTEGRPEQRAAILRGNAERLLASVGVG